MQEAQLLNEEFINDHSLFFLLNEEFINDHSLFFFFFFLFIYIYIYIYIYMLMPMYPTNKSSSVTQNIEIYTLKPYVIPHQSCANVLVSE
jgi:hypothetical protein